MNKYLLSFLMLFSVNVLSADISGSWNLNASFNGKTNASCGSTGSFPGATDLWTSVITFDPVKLKFSLVETNSPLLTTTYMGDYFFDGDQYVELTFSPIVHSRNHSGSGYSVPLGFVFQPPYYRFAGNIQQDGTLYLYEKAMYKLSSVCAFSITRYKGSLQ